jgi:hypothetical protein
VLEADPDLLLEDRMHNAYWMGGIPDVTSAKVCALTG